MAAPAPSQTAPKSARRGRRGLTEGLSMGGRNAEAVRQDTLSAG
jgi:hypothetical protein